MVLSMKDVTAESLPIILSGSQAEKLKRRKKRLSVFRLSKIFTSHEDVSLLLKLQRRNSVPTFISQKHVQRNFIYKSLSDHHSASLQVRVQVLTSVFGAWLELLLSLKHIQTRQYEHKPHVSWILWPHRLNPVTFYNSDTKVSLWNIWIIVLNSADSRLVVTDHVAARVEATRVPQHQHAGGGIAAERRRRRRDEGHRVLQREAPSQQRRFHQL